MKIEEMAANERREYMQKWRAANKERVKKHSADYWKRRATRRAKERGMQDDHTTQ